MQVWTRKNVYHPELNLIKTMIYQNVTDLFQYYINKNRYRTFTKNNLLKSWFNSVLSNLSGKENVIGVLAVLRNNSHILILMPYIDHVSFHVNKQKKDFLFFFQKKINQTSYFHKKKKTTKRIHLFIGTWTRPKTTLKT